ncbi:putative metal-binding motif-containing protein [Aestuariivivens sediminicola]|uniref:putative metal-binding motif-containing protein n=1 Tax=Aestuariivivens sediminicola TaxID=2913560 RepID=UPI001F59E301|nr:putative metal-binding motif-containing protein [Aestuariivivens sediminicola]
MKKAILCLFILLLVCKSFGQTAPPESFNFQAIISDGNKIVKGKPIGLEISIYQEALNGILVYKETFTEISDNSGIVNLQIGRGTPVFGVFSEINWGATTYFIGVAADPKGGNSYDPLGGSQLLSVPYALYSKEAGSISGPNDNDPTNEIQTLSLDGNTLKLSSQGGEVTLPQVWNFSFYYADIDGDGYGFKWNVVYADQIPFGYVNNPDDCDDSNANINPGMEEICDGIDNNCNGEIDEGCTTDADGDGYTVVDGDCNDNDPSINPSAYEVCGNNIDENCDGNLNPDFCEADMDNDGYSLNNGDCNDLHPNISPGSPEICGDGIDNNCDGQIDEDCACTDGQTQPCGDGGTGIQTCVNGVWQQCITDNDNDGFTSDIDCDDNNPNEFPGQIWYIDCDGDGYYNLIEITACSENEALNLAGCSTTYSNTTNSLPSEIDCYDEPNGGLIYPGSTTSRTVPYGDGSFDYNCDGVETKIYQDNVVSPILGFQQGWVGTIPECGETGIWAYDYHYDGLAVVYHTNSRTQPCQ